MTATKSMRAAMRSWPWRAGGGSEQPPQGGLCGSRNSLEPSDLFLRRELACFFLEHHRDIVPDRIGQSAGLADQFSLRFLIEQRPLAQRADEDIKQLGVHAGISTWPQPGPRAPGRPRPRPEDTTSSRVRMHCILLHPSR